MFATPVQVVLSIDIGYDSFLKQFAILMTY